MGACKYCGDSAGFLRGEHKECSDRHERASHAIKDLCVDAVLNNADLDALPSRIREAASKGFMEMSDDELVDTLSSGWCIAVQESMEDHSLSSSEKRGLNRYRERFGLTEEQLDSRGHFRLFRMMNLLGSLSDSGIVPRFDRRAARAEFGQLPFNFMKSEALIWVFDDVGYMEQITRREYRGSSMGASFRVAKGVYIRPGTFRGRTVESKSMERTDSGMLGITTKHIYFGGKEKRFRVRLEKIVSFEPYSNGLGIMRDTARAKPETFILEGVFDSWFLINVIETLMDMDSIALPKGDTPTLDDILAEELDDDEDDGAGVFMSGVGALS